jgi:predicted ATPase
VVPTVAQTLDLRETPGYPLLATLTEYLAGKRLLLVLDNCEHLIEACAGLATAVLRAGAQAQLLATSREGLAIPEETLYRVPSLAFPDPHHLPPLAELPGYAAMALLLQRAQARGAPLALTAQTAPAAAQICARLDGIPLALELAAARLGALSVTQVAARLDDCFGLLTAVSRTALPRQQTLRATVEWSYSLLAPREQTLFARLSIFAGGWSLEAAEEVGAGGAIAAEEVLDLLARLVDKSLVVAEEVPDDGSTRYRLLDTLRQYGRARLAASGETTLVQRRHAAYFLALVERAEHELRGPDQLRWLDLLEREHDNLRAALAWCLERAAPGQGEEDAQAVETGLRLAGGLHWFWLFRDHNAEGLAWLEQLLARGAAAPAAVRAKALHSAGVQAGRVNDRARSLALLAEGVALSREVGDGGQLSVALGVLGWATWLDGQEEQAATVLEESVAVARAVGEPWPIAHALMHCLFRVANSAAIGRAEERARAWAAGEESLRLYQAMGNRMFAAVVQLRLGQVALYEGDYARARAAFVACLPSLRAQGGRSFFAEGLVRLADVAREQGDYGEASALYAEGLTLYRDLGDQWLPAIAWVLSRLAAIALEQGEWTVAQTLLTESLGIARDTGQVGAPERDPELAGVVEVGAALAAVQGAPGRALRLAGAAAAMRVHLNRPAAASEQATLERRLAPARQALSAEKETTALVQGQAMTPEQAIAYALDGLPPT